MPTTATEFRILGMAANSSTGMTYTPSVASSTRKLTSASSRSEAEGPSVARLKKLSGVARFVRESLGSFRSRANSSEKYIYIYC